MSFTQLITDGTLLLDTTGTGGLLDVAPSTTTLAAAITTTGQTAVTLTSGTHAVNGAYIQCGAEIMLVQSGGGTVNVVVARGMNGTTAATHLIGATVNLPGSLIFNCLTIAQAPNVQLFFRKTSSDINYVAITAGSGNSFPGGGTAILLIDNGANGTAHIKFPGSGSELIVLASGNSAVAGPPGPAGPSATPPGVFTLGTLSYEWLTDLVITNGRRGTGAGLLRIFIPVTPPVSMGVTKGIHPYAEIPDVSITPTARMDGVTIMDGSYAMQDNWAPVGYDKIPYVAAEQPFHIDIDVTITVPTDIRIYAPSYSDAIDTPLVQFGQPGASPSSVITVSPFVPGKPASGSNRTTLLVTSLTTTPPVVGAAVTVSGKLRRPISITVDLTGLPAVLPHNWGYQLRGYKDGDITSIPYLVSGVFSQDGLIPAGPDGIDTPHTFGPEEPTVSTSITVYAVAGVIESNNARLGSDGPTFLANNIVPGITASCVVTIGTTTGVTDPTQFIAAYLNGVFGNVAGLFDITPLAIDNSRQGLAAIATLNLQALAVTNPKLAALAVQSANLASSSVTASNNALGPLAVIASSMAVGSVTVANAALAAAAVVASNMGVASVTAGNSALAALAVVAASMATNSITAANGAIANLAVGTGAYQLLSVTNAILANLSVGSAQIQNLAVLNAHIFSLDVSKLTAGTISVALTATNLSHAVTGSGFVINLDSTNGLKVVGNSTTTTITNATDPGSGQPAGMKVLDTSGANWWCSVTPFGFFLLDSLGNRRASLTKFGNAGRLRLVDGAGGGSIEVQSDNSAVVINGSQVLSTRVTSPPVTLADAIAVLQHHGLCS